MSAWSQVALANMLVGYAVGLASPWRPPVPVTFMLIMGGLAVIVRPFGRKNRADYDRTRQGTSPGDTGVSQ